MWNVLILAVLAILVLPGVSRAENGRFGLGVVVGEPTGLSGKLFLDAERKTAVDLGAAWSLSDDNEFQFHGDYLFHQYKILKDAFQIPKGEMPLYFGVGGRAKFRENKDDKVGIRIPVGVAYFFEGAPLELFAEIVPILNLAPDTEGDLGGGVGVRFYFPS